MKKIYEIENPKENTKNIKQFSKMVETVFISGIIVMNNTKILQY
jgi:hypothetical protein